ncbi:hypothetical protein RD792_010141 [Penstemon davidsonii]|uniref:Cytochrome P450 n=1 Tax=Penstemon davidsonii TaxID=160366 RepID=A0ABR0D110_9LAMI|nr:hypothetical protein RD792_010141 [Penstemon davidsonii]
MDLLSFQVQTALFLAIVLVTICYLKKSKENSNLSHQIIAPEPPGAWPIIGHLHLLSGPTPLARTLGALANKHGPIFSLRLGTHQALVISNMELIKQCFTSNDRVFATLPNTAVGQHIGYANAVFGLAPYGSYWRYIKKLVTLQLMTATQLEKLKPLRSSEVGYFIKNLYQRVFGPVEMTIHHNEVIDRALKGIKTDLSPGHALHYSKNVITLNSCLEDLTFNIITRILVGKRFSSGESSELKFKEGVKKALYLSGVFVLSDAISILEWFDVGGYLKKMKETAKELDQVLEEWLQERIEMRKRCGIEETDQSDFVDVMLSALPEGENVFGFKRETVVKATMLILILTGSESTAETLTWAISLLLNNNHAFTLAQEELDAKVGMNKWVEESDIKNLHYLQSIIKETLRLYPPGPLAGPHQATKDCNIGGYYVPKGTRLIVNLWKLHRDPNVWIDFNEFRLERFLNEHRNVDFKGKHFEYIPFGAGRRMCPGMTFGLQVVHLTLARLIQGFNISTYMGGPVDMGEGLGIALPKLKPLEVVLTPRLAHELYENL